MQTRSEFIASGVHEDEVAARIGADRVIFQDLHDMEAAVRRQNPAIRSFCTACFSGKYPSGDVSRSYLEQIEQEREQLKLKQKELALKF